MMIVSNSIKKEVEEIASEMHTKGERQRPANFKGNVFQESIISFDKIKKILFEVKTPNGVLYVGTED